MNASIRRHPSVLVTALLCATLVACTGAAPPSSAPSSSAEPAAAASAAPSTAPSAASASASAFPVPAELLARVVTLAADETGLDPTAIVIVSAEPVTWKDGSLDCPKIGVMYTQGIEDGYKVVVTAGARTLDYRWGRSGDPRLCLPPGASGG
jgi:hypothetical protein